MSELTLGVFADQVGEIMPMIAREFFRRQETGFSKMKITLPQVVILDLLHKRGESSMTDLADILNVTTAAMTGIVDRLVRDGYVVRLYDPEDRRVVRAKLTAKGARTVTTIAVDRKRMIVEMFGKLSQDEREAYLRILTKIKEQMASE